MPNFVVVPFEAVIGLLVSLISHFNSKEIAFLFAFAILLGSAILWAAFLRRPHRVFCQALLGASKAVTRAAENESLSAGDRIAAADAVLRNSDVVGHAWRPYKGSLRPDPRKENGLVNPVDPFGWFSPDRLGGHGYEKWVSTMAGVSLTLGLLFTFVGLSAALFKVGDAGNNTGALRSAIAEILTISSAKFITSMAGIIAYIVWTIVARLYSSSQAKLAAKLASAIQMLSSPITPEALLLDQLEESRQQSSRLKTLADDMAVAFDASLNKVLGQRLDGLPAAVGEILQPALERTVKPVVDAIQGMGGSIGQGNQAALERMIGDLKSEVTGSAGREMQMLAAAMQGAADELKAAKTGIGNGGTEFGQILVRAANEMSATSARMAAAMEGKAGEIDSRMSRIEATLSSGASRFQDLGDGVNRQISEGLAAALRSVAAASAEGATMAKDQSRAAMEPVLLEMKAMLLELRDTAKDGGRAIVEGGRAAATELRTALADAGAELSKASHKASTALVETFDQSTSRMLGTVEEAVAGYRQATEALAERLGAVERGFGQLEQAVSRNTRQLDQAGGALSVAGQTFGAATDQLRQATAPVLSALQSVDSAAALTRETLRSFQETGGTLRETAGAMSTSAQAAVQAFGSYERRFAGVDSSLGQTIERMRDGVVELGTRVSEVVQHYDEHLARAVQGLKQGVSELTEAVEEIGARLPKAA